MSEVTVRAVQPVLGIPDGGTVTIEKTRRVAAAIEQGHLVVVDPPTGTERVETIDIGAVTVGAPDESATRQQWARFLSNAGIAVNRQQKKADLIAAWKAHNEGDSDLDQAQDADADIEGVPED
ncbi:hypothetical protein C6V83_18070 [Gordonia iterans]|uniref:Uncharacterized protein n=1 Tax=Gordonia iterans TaxID=1004901 RepID=A0A2S0KJM2_9ACTN|nr:hypothetical protein [Gordonia iterans]AVM01885.1 hypothetical protein C6V83_18070 [Gordonia iterans]